MPRFLVDFFPNVANYWDIFLTALTATYQMFFIAGLITLLIGGAFGISLIVTKTDGIKPNRIVHFILEVITNVFRAVPCCSISLWSGSILHKTSRNGISECKSRKNRGR